MKERRINIISMALAVAFVIQIAMAYPLWLSSSRELPLVSLIGLPSDIGILEYGLFGAFFLGLLGVIFSKNKRLWIIGAASLAGLLIAQDVNRLQVWSFQYIAMLGVIAGGSFVKKNKEQATIFTLQWVMIGTYFWGGIQKLNIYFIQDVYPWLLESFDSTFIALAAYEKGAYVVAIFETLLGLGLMFPKLRKLFVPLVCFFHIGIVVLINIGLDWNWIIWPWNAAMAVIVWQLFPISEVAENKSFSIFTKDNFVGVQSFVAFYIVVFLFGIAPLLHLNGGYWDGQLSLKMYSGDNSEVIFFLDKKDMLCFPQFTHSDVFSTNEDDIQFLSIDDWAFKELRIPFYGGDWAFKDVGRQLCDCLKEPEKGGIQILWVKRWDYETKITTITCGELGK